MPFTPSQHGFHFSNMDIEWQVTITPPRIPITVPIRGTQLCGGMVYAALDYFHLDKPVPRDTQPPPIGTRLNDYITARQVRAHQTLPKFIYRFTPRGVHDMKEETADEIAKLKRALAGGANPLCLVRDGGGHHVLALGCTGDASDVTIKVYDPGYPDVTCTLVGSAQKGLKNLRSNSEWLGFFVDDNYSMSEPPTLIGDRGRHGPEGDWRWCGKCMALFWEGGPTNGICPTIGPHLPHGRKNYLLNRESGIGEHGWRWCKQCLGVFHTGNGKLGVCSQGKGGHDNSYATDYVIPHGSSTGDYENGWRYCRACQVLYYANWPGICPARKGGHDTSSTWDYCLTYTVPA